MIRFLLLSFLIGSSFQTAFSQNQLEISSPLDYQVIQRQTLNEGTIPVLVKLNSACDKVELQISGTDRTGKKLHSGWTRLLPSADNSFTAQLKTPSGGWYVLSFRVFEGGKVVAKATINHVGVGEVFVGAGQSNSTNFGETKEDSSKYPLDGRIESVSGFVTSFDGLVWRIANDPQQGAHDKSGGGSFWPAFGNAMIAKFHVPIGVAVTGHGGTSVSQWKKDAILVASDSTKVGLYGWTLTRIKQLGKNGFRAVIWHQGESDYNTPAQVYADDLEKIISDFRKDAGWNIPWFVAHASFVPGKEVVDTNSRGGQKILWGKGVALEGPDSDKMLGDLRDHGGEGIHFSKKGLKVHGEAWAEKVGSWLETELISK